MEGGDNLVAFLGPDPQQAKNIDLHGNQVSIDVSRGKAQHDQLLLYAAEMVLLEQKRIEHFDLGVYYCGAIALNTE